MTTVFTAEEVARHNKDDDLWMIMHGGVYDLTKFLQEHPGGDEVLLSLAGVDGTICFEEMGHTTEAVQLRETMKIGILEDGSSIGGGGPGSSKPSSSEVTSKKSSLAAKITPKVPINTGTNTWEYAKPKSTMWTKLLVVQIIIYLAILFFWPF